MNDSLCTIGLEHQGSLHGELCSAMLVSRLLGVVGYATVGGYHW